MADAESRVEASKQTIRERAVAFAKRWADTTRENAEKQSFWNEFFAVFGIDRKLVGVFEALAQRASTGKEGWIDCLYPGQLAVEHKSAGKDLDAAMDQLIDYLPSLHQSEHPWLLVVSDFKHFQWRNLETGEKGAFSLGEFQHHLDLFWWMAGHALPHEQFETEEDANLAATALLEVVHDGLKETGYDTHALRQWLTRILFCLFADDTDVWDRALFHAYLARYTRPDGSDLGHTIASIFQILNTSDEARPRDLDDDLASFVYINGDIFADTLPIPFCNEGIRTALLAACSFNWGIISPAIFGSLFQNVMEDRERRQLGAHYTTEQNILRTIRPLFLDELEAELVATTTKPKLEAFHEKLASLAFFDPACGCGNFLVIAYREIRRLETETLRRLGQKQRKAGQRRLDLNLLCKVRVDQFYGIELEEFPARIARTALYLVDHMANRDVSAEFGEHYVRFPIPASPHIQIGNALRTDWNSLLSAEKADYVFGNPPFGGHVTRSKEQSDDLRHVWGSGYAKWLDYVTAWYRVAVDYDQFRTIKFAFVSTNSISQGEQVARLWQPMFDAGYEIDFAYPTFAWTSEAKGKANVHVVIVGFSAGIHKPRRIFHVVDPYRRPTIENVSNISPYLTAGPNVAVAGISTPLSPTMPPVRYGSLPSDGGGLVVDPDDYPHADPIAAKYLRPYVGSNELVKGLERWVIWMPNGPDPGDLKASPFLRDRLESVRVARLASDNPDTRALASQPYKWFHNAQPTTPYIGIPAQVSETRRWYTVAHFDPDTIASNTLYTADDPDGFLFAVVSSSAFIVWVRSIGGKLESRLRYSKSVVHNTFPLPPVIPAATRAKVVQAGKGLLATRADHPKHTLAELYDPLATPSDIVKAHANLDRAVDAIFRPRKTHWTDDERLSCLLREYVQLLGDDPASLFDLTD